MSALDCDDDGAMPSAVPAHTRSMSTGGRIKKPRLSDKTTIEDLLKGHDRCRFLLESKKRLCRMAPCTGSLYCGNHLSVMQPDPTSTPGERVPCPLDPSHTVYKKSLDKHLLVCNVVKDQENLLQNCFYCLDCNSGDIDMCDTATILDESSIDADALLRKINACYEKIICDEHSYDFLKDFVQPFVNSTDSTRQEYARIEAVIIPSLGGSKVSERALRHARQDAHIVHTMVQSSLLYQNGDSSSECYSYIELGSGQGLLSHAISCYNPLASIVMVEKAPNKHKVDKDLRNSNIPFYRLRMDIRHCNIARLPSVPQFNGTKGPVTQLGDDGGLRNMVIVAKHLCGRASDLAIIAATNNDSSVTNKVKGLAVATCCHHALSWSDYTGRELLVDNGFTENEFLLLRHWAGWHSAVRRGNGTSDEAKDTAVDDNDHPAVYSTKTIRPSSITVEEMSVVGKKLKRIFDQGRIHFLRSKGFHAFQKRYCDPSLSPECFIIVARKGFE